MFAGGTNWKLFAFGLAIIALVGFLVVSFPNLIENYAGARIEAWLDKDFDPTGARWQTNNSLYSNRLRRIFRNRLGQFKAKISLCFRTAK